MSCDRCQLLATQKISQSIKLDNRGALSFLIHFDFTEVVGIFQLSCTAIRCCYIRWYITVTEVTSAMQGRATKALMCIPGALCDICLFAQFLSGKRRVSLRTIERISDISLARWRRGEKCRFLQFIANQALQRRQMP